MLKMLFISHINYNSRETKKKEYFLICSNVTRHFEDKIQFSLQIKNFIRWTIKAIYYDKKIFF